MKWSIRLGRVLGIEVYIHLTFLLLLAFIGMMHWMQERSVTAAMVGVLFFAALFACVLLHEYGHALVARRYGIPTRDITLLPIGGVARLERMPDQPGQELWVALAGPAVNVVIAAALAAWLSVTARWEPFEALGTVQGNFAQRLLIVNLFLVVFNLLPAFPMDGGRVLRALLAMRMDYARATNIAANIGQGMAFLFGFVGLFSNPMLLFIALFVWIGASQEAAAAQMKSSLTGARVQDAMLTEFRVLAPNHSLGEAARMLLAGSQQDFPVVEDSRLAGILTRSQLLEGLSKNGVDAPVSTCMREDFEAVDINDTLENALAQAQAGRSTAIPVLRDGALAGLLTAENIGEYFMIKTALGKREGAHKPPPIIRVPPVIRPRAASQ